MADTLAPGKNNSAPDLLGIARHLSRGFPIGLCLKKVGAAIVGLLAANALALLLVLIMAPSGGAPTFAHADENASWEKYRSDLAHWNLWHEVAGVGQDSGGARFGLGDLARSKSEYLFLLKLLGLEKTGLDPSNPDQLAAAQTKLKSLSETGPALEGAPDGWTVQRAHTLAEELGREKPASRLVAWLWFEDRGPNPILALTQYGDEGLLSRFAELVSKELNFALEPLRKLILPLYYLVHPEASFGQRLFFLFLLIATLSVWTLVGGVIVRMAALEFTRKQTIGLPKAVEYVAARKEGYLLAPWLPAVPAVVILLGMVIFGLFHLIPWVGDILVSGLGWVVMVGSGLVLAVIALGLLGWPLMTIAVSVESDDAFAATTKPYSYFGQKGWLALGSGAYCALYGSICLIFLCWLLSLGVYLGKWGVSTAPGVKSLGRSPEFLFVYAPTTFGWRDLLLKGATTPEGNQVVEGGKVNKANLEQYKINLSTNQKVSAFLASGWLYVVALPLVGLGYSLFWSFMTGIYLVLRKAADDVEYDDVFLDEEDDPAFAPVQAPAYRPSAPPAAEPSKSGMVSLSVIEQPPAQS